MKLLSHLSLLVLLSLSACAHKNKECCDKKEKMSCTKEECKTKTHDEKKSCCKEDSCHKKS